MEKMKEKKQIKVSIIIIIAIIIIGAMLYFIYLQKIKLDTKMDNLQDEAKKSQLAINELRGELDAISNTISNKDTSGSNNADNNTNNKVEKNKVIIDSNRYPNLTVSKAENLDDTLFFISEGDGASIRIYKPINSSNISDSKQYIQKHSFQDGFLAGDDLKFVNKTTIDSNSWMEFFETVEGSGLWNRRVYAANSNNNLCIIDTEISKDLENKYNSLFKEIVGLIQKNWDLNNPNEFIITVEQYKLAVKVAYYKNQI